MKKGFHLLQAFALTLCLTFSLSACASHGDNKAHPDIPPSANPSEPLKGPVKPETFEELAQGKNTIVMDLRTPKEYVKGHIARAYNYDVEDPSFITRIALLDSSQPVAIYSNADDARIQKALKKLKDGGFNRVYTLTGGLRSWENIGLPLESGNGK